MLSQNNQMHNFETQAPVQLSMLPRQNGCLRAPLQMLQPIGVPEVRSQ